MQHEVPIIDLAPFRTGDAAQREAIATQINEALERIGFFVITGHGIAPETIRRGYAASQQFFDLPLDTKNEVRIEPGSLPRGYLPYGSVALGQTEGKKTPPDLKQSFALGPHQRSDNRWPALDGFCESTVDLYSAMARVMGDMLDLFALALKVDPHFFHEKFEGHNSTLRLFDYPALTSPPDAGQFRSGPHTDYGALTILSIGYDDPGGLQARNLRGDWVDVVAPPGSFVINIGDLMMMWTNDRWLSNLHRVVLPDDPKVAMRRRQSIGFFANPRADVLIECIPGCSDAAHPARHAAIKAGEHRMNKVRASESVAAG